MNPASEPVGDSRRHSSDPASRLGAVARGDRRLSGSLIVLPLGATEQHGPHLPLGTDSIIVEHVVKSAVARIPEVPVLIAPTLTVGYSEHHLEFGATCTASPLTYGQLLFEMCASLARSCSAPIMLVNGHAGNAEIMYSVVRRLATEERLTIAAGSYWQIAQSELRALGSRLPARVPGHAGVFETSIMLALDQTLVGSDVPGPTGDSTVPEIDGLVVDAPRRRIGRHGYTDDASRGSVAQGQVLLRAIDAGMCRALRSFWEQRPAQP